MINTMSIAMPCAEPTRARLLPGASPLTSAFVVRTVADVQNVQGTGLPTHFGSKYGGQGSGAWSPPD